MSKPKILTFVWQSMYRHTINTLQWRTQRRTVQEAWDDAERYLIDRDQNCDPAYLLAFAGAIVPLDDKKPLRAVSKEDLLTLKQNDT